MSVDITKVKWIKSIEHKNTTSNVFEIVYYNGKTEEVEVYSDRFKGYDLLLGVDFKKEILKSLDRFAEDNEESGVDNIWNRLYIIVNEGRFDKLTEEDIEDINMCIEICTIFKEFDFKDYLNNILKHRR